MNINMQPPDYLDGAKVIRWAWSGQEPFGFINYENAKNKVEIYGFAICKYDNGEGNYRFSCDKNWEVVQDGLYDTIENAIKQIPAQYKNIEINWQVK